MGHNRKIRDRIGQELLKVKQQIAEIKSNPHNPAESVEAKLLQAEEDTATSLREHVRERVAGLEKTAEEVHQAIIDLRRADQGISVKVDLAEELLKRRITEVEKANEELRQEIGKERLAYGDLAREMRVLEEQLKKRIEELEQANEYLRQEVSKGRQTEEKLKNKAVLLEEQLKGRIIELEQANDKLQQEINNSGQAVDSDGIETANHRAADAVIEINLEGNILNWDSRAEIMYGYSSQHVNGYPFFILVPRERYDELQRIIDRAKLDQEVSPAEAVLVKKNGEQIRVSVSASPIKDGLDKITGVSITTCEIATPPRQKEKKNKMKKAK